MAIKETDQTDLVREALDRIIPVAVIREAIRRLGVQQRQRILDPVALVSTMILVGGTAEAGRLAAVLRDYYATGRTVAARSAGYKWFDEELLALMRELVALALDDVRSMPRSLPGILGGVTDWRAFDSTTVKLPDGLKATWMGTGDYAALKVHKEYSLGAENVVAYHIGPARDHDGPHLVVDESRRGTGLLVDLGYASHALLRRCEAHGVAYVIRAKGGWNLFIDDAAPTGERAGWRLPEGWTAPSDAEVLAVPGEGELDIDVTLGPEEDIILSRLVAFTANNERVVLMTNLPRTTHPLEAVGMLYRLRWCIETDNKLVKTGCQLDGITAERPVAAEILVHASMLASILANALCHAAHVEDGGVGERAPKMSRPPLHAMLVWKYITAHATSIAVCAAGEEDPSRWPGWRKNIIALGGDPNWRSRPSPLDEVKRRVPSRRPWRAGQRMLSAPRPRSKPRVVVK